MAVAYYEGPFNENGNPTFALAFDILHVILYIYFYIYLIWYQHDRWASGNRWVYFFTLAQLLCSVLFVIGDVLFYSWAHPEGGYCLRTGAELILFSTMPVLFCQTLIDD